ncbi:alkaline phosphatase family protein [Halioxenophilus sp. WMMB6]|uniref:alkaline phosphatase family protein n=1 Tax=Halioxenophilus sp. WMMB6 TaxID=3073815 RepID=UPI00295E699B|nr:alkaline phosphatase family protein [Halioxenophilus sp. WMMB6]
MKNYFGVVAGLLLLGFGLAANAADNLVLVTLDGLRWQELFRGYDEALLNDENYTEQAEALAARFGGASNSVRREKLMPFIWQQVAANGVLVGNRDAGSAMAVTNPWWFSYPGYNEILTGLADPGIDSNAATPNPNVTFLEWLNQQPGYNNSVAAFGSWDVFPAILNVGRSRLPVNAGFMPAAWPELSERAEALNELQAQTPSPWHNVRLDAFTMGFAKEYLLAKQPKVLFVSLGETDDFAHDKEYHQYLNSAHRADTLIADLWQTLQSLPGYRNNTNLIISVDHGRGYTPSGWPHHASARAATTMFKGVDEFKAGIVGSDQIWLAAIGPDIKALGELHNSPAYFQNQIAATALRLLEQNPEQFNPAIGKPLTALVAVGAD